MSANQDRILNALGDPTRRAVLELVASRPRSVGEIAAELPVSRPAVSQHLRVLRDAGLVRGEAVGTRRLYRVEPTGAEAVRAYLDQVWGAALESFRIAAESPERSTP